METTKTLTFEETARARHSVRKYEKGFVIPEAELNEIFEIATTAPSSWNLQHWKFIVVAEQANKDALLPIAYGQQQVADCSAVIVVLGDLEANTNAEKVFGPAVQAGFMKQEAFDALNGNIQNAYTNNDQWVRDEAFLNAGFVGMQLMLAAKAKGYDTVPMGGFNKQQLIEALNIPSRYVPVMLLPIGKAASPAHPTGRFAVDQVIVKESF